MEIITNETELALLIQRAIAQGYNHKKTDDILRDAWPEAQSLVLEFSKAKQIKKTYPPCQKILDFFGIKK